LWHLTLSSQSKSRRENLLVLFPGLGSNDSSLDDVWKVGQVRLVQPVEMTFVPVLIPRWFFGVGLC